MSDQAQTQPQPTTDKPSAGVWWHTITSLLMHRMGLTHVTITTADVAAMAAAGNCVVTLEDSDGLHIKSLPKDEAYELLGQPVPAPTPIAPSNP